MKHTEFWTSAVTKLLSSLHDILDELYSPFETGLYFLFFDGLLFICVTMYIF